MVVKLSISLDEGLAKLIKDEATKSKRTVSEVFADAIRAYQKERRREAYARFAKSKAAKEFRHLEEAQFELARKLK